MDQQTIQIHTKHPPATGATYINKEFTIKVFLTLSNPFPLLCWKYPFKIKHYNHLQEFQVHTFLFGINFLRETLQIQCNHSLYWVVVFLQHECRSEINLLFP